MTVVRIEKKRKKEKDRNQIVNWNLSYVKAIAVICDGTHDMNVLCSYMTKISFILSTSRDTRTTRTIYDRIVIHIKNIPWTRKIISHENSSRNVIYRKTEGSETSIAKKNGEVRGCQRVTAENSESEATKVCSFSCSIEDITHINFISQ